MEALASLPQADLARWLPLARAEASAPLALAVPLDVLLGEAVSLARFTTRFLAAGERPDGTARPGLRSANRRNAPLLFDEHTAADLLSLAATTREAHTGWLLALTPGGQAERRERADFVLRELEGALDFVLDDGIDEPFDAQLAQLQAAHAVPTTDAGRAAALHAYATLASTPELAAALTDLEAFDEGLVAEARRVADALLLEASAAAVMPPEVAALQATRNQLAHLLQARVRLVRAAARYVFRHDPAIAREATSVYERRRRAEARRRALVETLPAAPAVPDAEA